MPEFFKKPMPAQAWLAVGLWLLAYGLLKLWSQDGLDLDSAEQVYFAQSWQMGYGTRQPPLYTWLVLLAKPAWLSWPATLEWGRYLCLVLWLAGVQVLARGCGATPSVQARTVLAHLGLMLAMWRVHDSLTHTVLAAAITVWACAALVRALSRPRYWLAVGALAALACLSKLNAALWCLTSLPAAWAVIWMGRSSASTRAGEHGPRSVDELTVAPPAQHLRWMGTALLLFLAMLSPYAHWWLKQPSGSMALARRIVVSEADLAWWTPLVHVVAGSLEYLLLAPLLLAFMAWRARAGDASVRPPASAALRWLQWQTTLGFLVLVVLLVAMKASHFTPRWLWPVMPGVTVWLCVRALPQLDQAQGGASRWRTASSVMLWLLVAASIGMAAVRVWTPATNARRCANCWTDRPAAALSATLHARHGAGPLRIIAGDDHLAGILAQVHPQDRTWTADSPDLPAPTDFIRGHAPCVLAWIGMDRPPAMPDGLALLKGDAPAGEPAQTSWPLRLAPRRQLWLASVAVPDSVCDKARR